MDRSEKFSPLPNRSDWAVLVPIRPHAGRESDPPPRVEDTKHATVDGAVHETRPGVEVYSRRSRPRWRSLLPSTAHAPNKRLLSSREAGVNAFPFPEGEPCAVPHRQDSEGQCPPLKSG